METIQPNNPDRDAYKIARRKVKKLKNFYVHLIVYLLVNAFVLLSKYKDLEPGQPFVSMENFSLSLFWGIGLVAHAFSVFVPHFILGKDWENRKMKQFIDRENHKWE